MNSEGTVRTDLSTGITPDIVGSFRPTSTHL